MAALDTEGPACAELCGWKELGLCKEQKEKSPWLEKNGVIRGHHGGLPTLQWAS